MSDQTAAVPESAGTLAIEIEPYAPGLLLMTIPVGLILPEAGAVKLLGQIHDGLDKLRKLMADQAAYAKEEQKKGRPVRQGIGAPKRKR